MTESPTRNCTAFVGFKRLSSGPLPTVALAVKRALQSKATEPIVIFDDSTGRSFDIDTRGSDKEIVARLPKTIVDDDNTDQSPDGPRGRGRPRLNVVGREVTLLPRHWDWLNVQPGGASVSLRKLVDAARRANTAGDQIRRAKEAAYYFMSTMAGDLPGFEEASRALFAGDRERLESLIAKWPKDVRNHVAGLAFAERTENATN